MDDEAAELTLDKWARGGLAPRLRGKHRDGSITLYQSRLVGREMRWCYVRFSSPNRAALAIENGNTLSWRVMT